MTQPLMRYFLQRRASLIEQEDTILRGQPHEGSSAVALNAGAALYVAGRAGTLRDGVNEARAALAKGTAWDKVQMWAAWTQSQKQTGAA